MWALGFAILLSRQENLQWLGTAELDGSGYGRCLAEPVFLKKKKSAKSANHDRIE